MIITLNPDCVFDKRCASVVFLRGGEVVKPHFYLARKKQDIHTDAGKVLPKTTKWNGYGGKWRPSDKNIYTTAIRELREESGGVRVAKKDLFLGGRIQFFWPGNTTDVWDMEVFFFTAYKYSRYPEETEEMGAPRLFSVYNAPYDEMMPADRIIIPAIMSGKTIQDRVYFSDNGEGVLNMRREPILAYTKNVGKGK